MKANLVLATTTTNRIYFCSLIAAHLLPFWLAHWPRNHLLITSRIYARDTRCARISIVSAAVHDWVSWTRRDCRRFSLLLLQATLQWHSTLEAIVMHYRVCCLSFGLLFVCVWSIFEEATYAIVPFAVFPLFSGYCQCSIDVWRTEHTVQTNGR